MSHVSETTQSLDTALAHAFRLMATDPALAGEQASEILKVVEDEPRALLLLGSSQAARGELESAVTTLGRLCEKQPNWAAAHLELGFVLGRVGRGEQAVAALRRALALKSDLPQGWLALANHLFAIGDTDAADAAYANHIRFSNKDRELLAAASALVDNRIPEAESLLRERLKKAPTDVAAIRMLAEIAARLGRHEDAELLLARCLELAPGFNAARHNYALVLHRANKPTEALAELDALLEIDPGNSSCRNLKAAVLCRIGDYDPAIKIYADLLAEYPGHPKLWLSYGHALKTAGSQDDAIGAYRKSIELDPGFGEAYWSLANLKTFRFESDDVPAMRRQLQRANLAPEARHHFEFALGKALEDEGTYAESFAHYLEGNRQCRATIPYSADDISARTRRSKKIFDADFFRQRASFGNDAADPIFVVGLPRAGSTLIEQILSSHSAVEGTMELPEIMSMARVLRQQAAPDQQTPYHDVLAQMSPEQLRELGERYLERTRVHRKSGAPYFIDKMPNNFQHIGLIHLALPNAKIIDARRHPMACCFSGFKQHFARGQDFTYDLGDIGRYYRDYVELMAHYDDVLPGRIHRVVYENMVDDTETEVRRLLAYCGLPFEEACLRFFENERPVRTASSEQVRKPIFREGIDHWRHFEPWLAPLKSALGTVLDAYPAAPEFNSGANA